MNIKLKTEHSFSKSRFRVREDIFTPKLSGKFNNKEERPFNSNSSNLSFKGLFYGSFRKMNTAEAESLLQLADKHVGKNIRELYEHLLQSNIAKKLIKIENEKLLIKEKSIPELIVEGAIYPIKHLPKDILNGTVGALRNFKLTKNWAEKTYFSTFFKNIRQSSKLDAKINSLKGAFESLEKLKGKSGDEISSEALRKISKIFDEKTGNYDTKHERALNRIVSGAIPAVFLANDAYNLSRMCNDNKKEADKEKKTRFKQEISRIFLNAYIMLITYGALQKHMNKSKSAVMLMTFATTLFTESISRIVNGKHVVRISKENAKKINEKENNTLSAQKLEPSEQSPKNNDYKSVFFKSQNNRKVFNAFMGKLEDEAVLTSIKPQNSTKPKQDKQKEPLLSPNTLFKTCLAIIAAGFALKGIRSIKIKPGFTTGNFIDKKLFTPFKNIYEKLTMNFDNKIKSEDFEEIILKLKQAGHETLAKKYLNIAEKHKTLIGEIEYIKLFKHKKKIKPLVDFIIAPFKFAYNAAALPYKLLNKIFVAVSGKKPPSKEITELEAFSKSIEFIGKAAKNKNYAPAKFKSYIDDNLAKAFNECNISGISNSDLSNLAKTSATAATLWFLMADNYNMVMIKSDGKDKEGAKLKSKERFVQEMSRLFYQTLLIDLFNSTFRSQYNKSLFGMSWITMSNTTLGEILTRKSVGMPVLSHTRDELVAIDKKKENAEGFLKGYYNFMTRLTGKKSLAEQHKSKQIKKS